MIVENMTTLTGRRKSLGVSAIERRCMGMPELMEEALSE